MRIKTQSDWGGNIVPTADRLLGELRREFSLAQVLRLCTALERAANRAHTGEEFRQWREARGLDEMVAARELGVAVEELQDIEAGRSVGDAEIMRRIRPVMRRVRKELGDSS